MITIILNFFGIKTKEQKEVQFKRDEARRLRCEEAFGIKGE